MTGPVTPTQLPPDVAALVDQWFFETFHGSAVARSAETWNLVHAGVAELKTRLAALLAVAPRS